ncbi:FAD-dependent oxidoreductase [Frigidibacter albus]|uniref:FAD-dependent oxidoreductase n=1 Tax=Frigidibacter albus TaxID=1465486 RepID=A0A6L8VDZ9_9RHOB|nr:FAD-binding oxidoreductase [Frigidibacter albus]MZQ87916.1 FAD-dependent oxidoreductase [Frigidibacter albus]NBE29822.1 FAD-dependent oxidoreductase [Frigidibacter albus]GGH42548.1 oxidoreductase [Frigidibacter albus]
MAGQADVTVHGAGIFGLATAWECTRRGAQVRVIEAARIGAGSSGGLVGALAPHVPEQWNPKKAFQLEALLMAERFWAEVAAAGGCDPGYARTGRLQPLADAAAVDLARARAKGAEALWQGRAEWRVIPAEADGWSPAAGSGFVVQDTLTARMAPRRAAAALAAAIRARGGEIVEGGGAEPEGLQVWATGAAGLAALSADLGRNVGGAVKGQSALLRPALDVRALPQIFAESLHIVPHADGSVAIGSTSEREFDAADSVDAQLEALIAKARALCAALAEAPVLERWAGARPRTRTRAPMLGEWPGRPGHFVANGGFKIGFGIAPKVAEVMADLVLEGRDGVPDGFRVEDSL